MLRDVELQRRYRSHTDDILNSFYTPCLRETRSYSRAVGYFSSGALSVAAQGLPAFLKSGGTMRLVASPHLGDKDLDAIIEGYERREEAATRSVTASLTTTSWPDPVEERLGFLGWLISKGRLDIKLALVNRKGTFAIYHEKLGLFEDAAGDRVAFLGSANESRGGLVSNFESIMVFRSWVEQERNDVEEISSDFESLWGDQTPGLEVYSFPEAAAQALRRLAPQRPPDRDPEEADGSAGSGGQDELAGQEAFEIPESLELRPYQRDALAAWFQNDGHGMLEMATGTGKTVTALSGAQQLSEHLSQRERSLLVVVVCPYQHLVRQWATETRAFGLSPVLCYQGREFWRKDLEERIHNVRREKGSVAIAIATNATFQTDAFQRLIAEAPNHSLLIADEAHNLGAKQAREKLPDEFRYKLGLSATPERWFDAEGTEGLLEYFGGVVYSFDLEQAIGEGALTPYDYYPHVVHLDGEELDEYLELTGKIGQLAYAGEGDATLAEGPLQMLLVKRARILASAHGKLPKLASIMRPLAATTHNLFYCGDGTVESDSGTGVRQLDAVVKLLGREVGMRVNSYTAENYAAERDDLRDRFAAGDLQGLVAIRCLDEGVDIPETRRAVILASSTNPRQFIQRRGRVLRRAPGKEKAEVHDFLVVPPADSVPEETWPTERRLVERELRRIALFAQLARNGAQALDALGELRKRYGLLHVG